MRIFNKVIVGISGGVDSAVAALLLKRKGYNILGAYMKNWDITDETGKCTSEKDFEDAQWVCKKLGIPIVEVNFVKEYWNEVFSYMIDKYQAGCTPNPDILCNKNIKFAKFLDIARTHYGADAIATGHYVRSSFGPYLEDFDPNRTPRLFCAADTMKDQTFFLCQVPPTALKHCMFPLGNYEKHDVKKIALEAGLDKIVKKKESMGICFIGKREFQDFINEYIIEKPGHFVDFDTGQIVGKHNGFHCWTVGQKCRIGGCLQKYYVLHKDLESGNIFVVAGKHSALYTDFLIVDNPHWFTLETEQHNQNLKAFDCLFRFQHRKPLIPCTVFKTSRNRLLVLLRQPTRAVTKGQFAVFYNDGECLGGGEISYPGPSYHILNKHVDINPEN